MKSYGVTDKGLIRKENQDSYSIKECTRNNYVILTLCDGMGGARSGSIASEISKRAFSDYVNAKLTSRINKYPSFHEVLRNACIEANGVAWCYSQFDEKYNGMGTTLVGAIVSKEGKVFVVNVGDSRAYILSKKKKMIRQITTDHSYVERLVHSGMISREAARNHRMKNYITRALGTEKSVLPDTYEEELKKGDVLLLCSDGLTNYVTDEEIYRLYTEDPTPENLCNALLELTFEHGAGDNVTIVAVEK